MMNRIGKILTLIIVGTMLFTLCACSKSKDSSEDNATLEQRHALKRAEALLEVSAHSYQGLIDQLEYEGFIHEDAVYAADRCGADWNKQAYRQVKSYVRYNSFTRKEIIRMLTMSDDFTQEQAIYAVNTAEIYD